MLSIFSENEDFVKHFDDFICNYDKLCLANQNEDTKYFTNVITNRNEIYFHYLLNSVEYEFSYNYSDKQKQSIKDFFGTSVFYLFDIQYRDELFLKSLMLDFHYYLKRRKECLQQKVLLYHSVRNIITFEDFNTTDYSNLPKYFL
jgi:hypothetical protein